MRSRKYIYDSSGRCEDQYLVYQSVCLGKKDKSGVLLL
jgi:hypothetical protein